MLPNREYVATPTTAEALESKNILRDTKNDSVLLFFRSMMSPWFQDNRANQPRPLHNKAQEVSSGTVTDLLFYQAHGPLFSRLSGGLLWRRGSLAFHVLVVPGQPAFQVILLMHGGPPAMVFARIDDEPSGNAAAAECLIHLFGIL